NATRMTSAFLNRLSFSAPRNWVQKNGANRRARRRATWLTLDLAADACGRDGLLVRPQRREQRVDPRLPPPHGGVWPRQAPEPGTGVALDDRREQAPARLLGPAGAAHGCRLVSAGDVHRRLLQAVYGWGGYTGGGL